MMAISRKGLGKTSIFVLAKAELFTELTISRNSLPMTHLEAMEKYIRRKRVIGYHRTNYLNIVAFTKRLMQLNIFDKTAATDLRKAMKAEEILTEREWLLEQL